ncbi:hypothetical protein XU06_31635 (plasmid) [Rhodococcus erythropolis]|nr:hypothetical protein XU06_31635 [Rhodococcus erythropolis]
MRLRVQHRCLEQHLDRTRAKDGGVATSITARVRFEPKIADPARAQRTRSIGGNGATRNTDLGTVDLGTTGRLDS